MKRRNKILIFFTLFVMIFQSSILPLYFFTSKIDNHQELSPSIKSLIPSSGSNLDYIEINYSVEYEIEKNGQRIRDKIPMTLTINGTDDLYENGTISYFIGKNITDETVLQLLSNVFINNQLDFFQNHHIDESFQTYFSYRRESMTNNLTEFLTNASFTLFWLNTTGHYAGYIKLYRKIQFLDVINPFSLGIDDDSRIIAEKTWSDKKSEISKNVRILNSFYLSANFDNEQIINLYYDKTWTILLRGTFENYDSAVDNYILDIKLVETNLELDFLSDNPYWDVRLRNLLIIIPLSSIACIIIVFMFRKKTRIQRKEDILDKI